MGCVPAVFSCNPGDAYRSFPWKAVVSIPGLAKDILTNLTIKGNMFANHSSNSCMVNATLPMTRSVNAEEVRHGLGIIKPLRSFKDVEGSNNR